MVVFVDAIIVVVIVVVAAAIIVVGIGIIIVVVVVVGIVVVAFLLSFKAIRFVIYYILPIISPIIAIINILQKNN